MSKPPEPIDLQRLPPDIREAVEALQSQVSVFKEANARLEHLVKELHHALYGKKSEKLAPDDRQLAFEDLEVAVAEAEEYQARPVACPRDDPTEICLPDLQGRRHSGPDPRASD